MNVDVITLLSGRQDRLEERVGHVEDEVKGLPELRRSVDRLITSVYAAGGLIVASAALVVLFGPSS